MADWRAFSRSRVFGIENRRAASSAVKRSTASRAETGAAIGSDRRKCRSKTDRGNSSVPSGGRGIKTRSSAIAAPYPGCIDFGVLVSISIIVGVRIGNSLPARDRFVGARRSP
jgi:hypothetical protein